MREPIGTTYANNKQTINMKKPVILFCKSMNVPHYVTHICTSPYIYIHMFTKKYIYTHTFVPSLRFYPSDAKLKVVFFKLGSTQVDLRASFFMFENKKIDFKDLTGSAFSLIMLCL